MSTRDAKRRGAAAGAAKNAPPNPPRDPDPPEDPPHAQPTLPELIAASRGVLHRHNFIDKREGEISFYTLVGILSRTARMPGVAAQEAAIIESVAQLLPEALMKAQHASDQSATILSKLEDVSKQIATFGSLDAKLAPICESLASVRESATRAKTSAADAEKSMQTLHKTLTWKATPCPDTPPAPAPSAGLGFSKFADSSMHLDRQARLSGRSVTFAGATSQPAPSRPPPSRRNIKLSDGSIALTRRVLVQPKGTAALDALSKLSARELVAKAELAADAAWKELRSTDFVKKAGRATRPTLEFKTAIRLPRGGIEFAMGTAEQASWLSIGPVATVFERGFGSDIELKGQHAIVKIEQVSTAFNIDQADPMGAIERENGLDAGDILAVSWFKPLARRATGQPFAVLKAELRSMDVADRLISQGGRIEFGPVQIRRLEEDPIQCLKCQKYGHLAAKCRETSDTCSHCGGSHRFTGCTMKDKKHCVSCGTDDHCSWDRQCPAFQSARNHLNERKPDNRRRFFNQNPPTVPTREATPLFDLPTFFQEDEDNTFRRPYASSNALRQTTIYDRLRRAQPVSLEDMPERPAVTTWGNDGATAADWETSEPLGGPTAWALAGAESPQYRLTKVRRHSDSSLSDSTTTTVRVYTPSAPNE